MPLNIRSEEANRLAAEVAIITGETMTDAVIQSLKERLDRLRLQREAQAVKRESRRDQLDRIALHCSDDAQRHTCSIVDAITAALA